MNERAGEGCSDPEEPLKLSTATYSLAEATRAWEAQVSSPGRKIVVIP